MSDSELLSKIKDEIVKQTEDDSKKGLKKSHIFLGYSDKTLLISAQKKALESLKENMYIKDYKIIEEKDEFKAVPPQQPSALELEREPYLQDFVAQYNPAEEKEEYDALKSLKDTPDSKKIYANLTLITKKNNYIYWLTRNKLTIVLNDEYLISDQHLDTTPDLLMKYCFENPNRKITPAEFEANCRTKLRKSFNNMLGDAKFKGELRKMFFEVSNLAIKLTPGITREDFMKMRIDKDKLGKQIKELPKI